MKLLVKFLLTSTALTPPPAPISIAMLAAPTLQDSTSTSPFEHSTGTLAPTAGALILVGFLHRAGTSMRSHSAPTAGFATIGGFVELLTLPFNDGLEDGTSNKFRLSIFGAIATGSPGTGTITCATNASTFQRIIAPAEVINWLSSTPFAVASAWAFSGTAVSGSLSPSATSTNGVGFMIGCQNSTTGTPDATTPFVDIASSPFTTGNLEGLVATFTGTPGSNTVEMTNGQSGRAKGVGAVFFNGAAA